MLSLPGRDAADHADGETRRAWRCAREGRDGRGAGNAASASITARRRVRHSVRPVVALEFAITSLGQDRDQGARRQDVSRSGG